MTIARHEATVDLRPLWTHYWWYRKWLPERKNQFCRVRARGNGRGPRNVLVEFPDGFRVVSTRFCVRKLKRCPFTDPA